MRIACARIAFRLNLQQFCRVIKNRCLRSLLRFAPATVAKRAQRRRTLPDADIPGDKKSLFERNIKPGIVFELQNDNLLLRIVLMELLNSAVASNPVLQMHDEIPFGNFRKIDWNAAASKSRSSKRKPARTRSLVTAKDFGITEDCKFPFGQDKSAIGRSDKKLNP